MDADFLCQDLEAKLFKWFEGRLDATKIKRRSEMSEKNTLGETKEEAFRRMSKWDLGMNQELIDQVIEQIKEDVENQDMTAIEELLRFVPTEYLLGYLSEVNNGPA
jgi:hypothetical protein